MGSHNQRTTSAEESIRDHSTVKLLLARSHLKRNATQARLHYALRLLPVLLCSAVLVHQPLSSRLIEDNLATGAKTWRPIRA